MSLLQVLSKQDEMALWVQSALADAGNEKGGVMK